MRRSGAGVNAPLKSIIAETMEARVLREVHEYIAEYGCGNAPRGSFGDAYAHFRQQARDAKAFAERVK